MEKLAGAALWLRGAIFTILVPWVVAVWIPGRLSRGVAAPGWWRGGWILVIAGGLLYLWSLLLFLLSGGTPAIFFLRPVRFLVGSEPDALVRGGPYRFTRNPMYVAVLAAIFGQAVLHRSVALLRYGLVFAVIFHAAVALLEEPHLRRSRGAAYEEYCRRVPRWLGRGKA